MKPGWIDPDKGPTPEQLAAYADGELTDADRAAVDAWLRHDPAWAAEVEVQRSATQWCRDSAPAMPDDGTWASVHHKIEAALNAPAAVPAVRPPWLRRLGLGAAAAAALALVLLGKSFWPVVPPDEEPFPVVAAEDVVILSISGSDTQYLVAAQPPVMHIGEHELVTEKDVKDLNFDDAFADAHQPKGAPMLIMPPPGWESDP